MSDFPIPSDLTGFWLWDRVHCPRPVAPLEYELLVSVTGTGFSNAMGELGSTLLASSKSINYYNYIGPVVRDLGGENKEARAARYKKNVVELMPKLGEKWEKEWLPSLLPALERSRKTDYATLSDAELLRRFDQMRGEVVERWSVHGMLLYAFFAAGQFADFYKEDELETHQRVERGEPLTADSMQELMADLFSEGFGPKVKVDRPRVGMIWSTFSHLFMDYYVYAYATGISGAHALAGRILRGEPNAAEDYLGFLKSGSSDYSLNVLRKAGVDLATPKPVEETFAVMESYIDRLEELVG